MAPPSSRIVRAEAEKAARQTLAARAALVGELADAAHEVEQIEGHLENARDTHTDLYQRAIDGGWTATDLAALGYDSPDPSSASRRPARQAPRHGQKPDRPPQHRPAPTRSAPVTRHSASRAAASATVGAGQPVQLSEVDTCPAVADWPWRPD